MQRLDSEACSSTPTPYLGSRHKQIRTMAATYFIKHKLDNGGKGLFTFASSYSLTASSNKPLFSASRATLLIIALVSPANLSMTPGCRREDDSEKPSRGQMVIFHVQVVLNNGRNLLLHHKT